jgi:hypothetical protein
MLKEAGYISSKQIARYGAMIAVAAVFAYSLAVMLYVIARSSFTIGTIMPEGERGEILWANAVSVAYSVAVFSLIMAVLSLPVGVATALLLKKATLVYNGGHSRKKAIRIGAFTALGLLFIIYRSLYFLLKARMTFEYAETLLFWFLFPALIFLSVCVWGAVKLNRILNGSFPENFFK